MSDTSPGRPSFQDSHYWEHTITQLNKDIALLWSILSGLMKRKPGNQQSIPLGCEIIQIVTLKTSCKHATSKLRLSFSVEFDIRGKRLKFATPGNGKESASQQFFFQTTSTLILIGTPWCKLFLQECQRKKWMFQIGKKHFKKRMHQHIFFLFILFANAINLLLHVWRHSKTT